MVHLAGIAALHDEPGIGALLLTDEVVVDEYQIVLPEDAPPGVYPVEVGLYVAENGRRLQVQVPLLPPSDVVHLNPLVVQE